MKKLSLFSLFILIVSAIDNIKNMPGAALFGSELPFFFLLSAIFFLIPTALVSAELAAAFPEKRGGVFVWVKEALGSRFATTAIWLQWINTMVWFPTMLSFIASTLAYLFFPQLAEHKGFLVTCMLSLFWGLTWINLKGIHASSRFTNICSTFGTIIPMVLLVVLGALWLLLGEPVAIHFEHMMPSLGNMEGWTSLIAIMASFLGIELCGVHVNEIDNPRRTFPKAIFLATLFIFFSMSLCSLAIAIVLPMKEISLVAGIMQVFERFFSLFGLGPLIPFLSLLIVAGSVGTMVNWLIAPAKGLQQAAEARFLPTKFAALNECGAPKSILIAQGFVVTFVSLAFLLIPSVNEVFWFLMALSTELYMLMYLLLFASALKLHHRNKGKTFSLSKSAIWLCCIFGMLGCIATAIVAFVPSVAVESAVRYLLWIVAGNAICLLPLIGFFAYEAKNQRCLGSEGME